MSEKRIGFSPGHDQSVPRAPAYSNPSTCKNVPNCGHHHLARISYRSTWLAPEPVEYMSHAPFHLSGSAFTPVGATNFESVVYVS